MDNIDYKNLLTKYINHVLDVEGYDFIEKIGDPASDVNFTEQEINVLSQISSGNI